MAAENRLFFQDDTPYPLGRLTIAGTLFLSRGIGRRKMRTLGTYALVLQTGGIGFFADVQGHRQRVAAGDCLLIFPDIAHAYGPILGQNWNEIFVCFEGPIFDQWRSESLFSPSRPLHHVENWQWFYERLLNLLTEPRPRNTHDHLHQLHTFLAILTDLVELPVAPPDATAWHLHAQALLRANLSENISLEAVAASAGMSYETFRKRFAAEVGISPSRFRDTARIHAAQTLLLEGALKNHAIARSLGFRDEAHLARRFRELVGASPREWKHSAQSKMTNE